MRSANHKRACLYVITRYLFGCLSVEAFGARLSKQRTGCQRRVSHSEHAASSVGDVAPIGFPLDNQPAIHGDEHNQAYNGKEHP